MLIKMQPNFQQCQNRVVHNNIISIKINKKKSPPPNFPIINDHVDILIEILKKLDGRSLGVAACVCRLWSTLTSNDSLWEDLCFRHVSPPSSTVQPVVLALGGYKRLYMVCVQRVLSRLGDSDRVLWASRRGDSMAQQLSLSLFCVDYYERYNGGGGGDASTSSSSSSLMFLCKPVNV